MQNYGERLKEYRKKHALTQADVAQTLSMPQSNYSRLEKGEQDIKLSMILHICSTLNLSTDWFLGVSDNYEEENCLSNFYVDVIDLICDYGDNELIKDEVVTKLVRQIDNLKSEYDID